MQFHIFYFILLQKSNYKRQINDFQEYLASLDYLEFLEFLDYLEYSYGAHPLRMSPITIDKLFFQNKKKITSRL